MDGDSTRETVRDRTLDLLRHTSSSIQVHLEQVEGWLRLARLPGEPDFWRVDVVAGPIGALADACGRLTLLSRITGTAEAVEGDLDRVMDGLTALLSRLLGGEVSDDEIDQIERLAEVVKRVYQTSVPEEQPG